MTLPEGYLRPWPEALQTPGGVASTPVSRELWLELMGSDPSLGSAEAAGAVERVSLFDAAAFLNALSARDGLSSCYVLQCSVAWDDAGAGCPRDAAWCLTTPPCAIERQSGDCGYRLPTTAEWLIALASSSHPPVSEWVWEAGRDRLPDDGRAFTAGPSWVSSETVDPARLNPTRPGLRAFNVGFRIVRDAPIP